MDAMLCLMLAIAAALRKMVTNERNIFKIGKLELLRFKFSWSSSKISVS